MMGVKTEKREYFTCDYCGSYLGAVKDDFIDSRREYTCPICGKQVCSEHCYYVYLPNSDDNEVRRVCREHLGDIFSPTNGEGE